MVGNRSNYDRGKQPVVVVGTIPRETTKAILVSQLDEGTGEIAEAWIPLSQIVQQTQIANSSDWSIHIPRWLAEAKAQDNGIEYDEIEDKSDEPEDYEEPLSYEDYDDIPF